MVKYNVEIIQIYQNSKDFAIYEITMPYIFQIDIILCFWLCTGTDWRLLRDRKTNYNVNCFQTVKKMKYFFIAWKKAIKAMGE